MSSSDLPPPEARGEAVALRPAAAGDRDLLRGLAVRCGIFTDEEIRTALEVIDESRAEPTGDDYATVCAVDSADAPVGFASYGRVPLTESSYDLYWIVVDPDHQRRGVGSRLIERVEHEIRQRRGTQLYVETSSQPSHGAARIFYERRGYRRAAVFPDFYRQGDDKIVYAKSLCGGS